VSGPGTRRHKVTLVVMLAVPGTALAQSAAVDPAMLVGGPSDCPSPGMVWQDLVPLVPSEVLVDRLRALGGPAPPVRVVDLGASFRVIAGARIREYPEAARDCAKRAQFAAVFVAVAAGADAMSSSMPPVPPVPPLPADVLRTAPVDVVASRRPARFRLELGANAGTALGGGETTIAPGLALRTAFDNRRLIAVAGVTVLAPVEGKVGGVGIRHWQATGDVDVRSASLVLGRWRAYAELGAAFALLADRASNLALARTQVSYAVGPRAAVGLLLATRGALSPFFLISGAWFPHAPELFALPAGDLGRAAAWNLGATAGASWSVL
jgi:hypothetical protein